MLAISKLRDGNESGSEDESGNESEDETGMNTVTTNDLERTSGFTQVPSEIALARILADVFHEMDKVCRTISKKHSLSKKFATAFSDTLLLPDEDDKKLISQVLAKKNLTYNQVRSKSPAWLWKRVRRYIPESNILVLVLREFFDSWGKIKCSITGQPLFSAETWKKAKAVLHDVRKGWLSDPSSIPVYTREGTDKNGLPLYHCIRGTNSVEGAIHNPIRRNFASLNASPELADALIADFRHRHNTDSGSFHKLGIQYSGHYDPWIDHEIYQLREDILWTKMPMTQKDRAPQDTDPLNFAPTKEKFGITAIPPMARLANEFFAAPLLPDVNLSVIEHSNKLWLSKLVGKRKDIYGFLAHAQNTKYAVTPLHTTEEYDLFRKAVSVGGDWCPPQGKPNFELMAWWWSRKADGKHIFYKLSEHLSTYYKIWSDQRQETQSMVISKPQRAVHEKRIRSSTYVSHVLPPAKRHQPGISDNSESMMIDIGFDSAMNTNSGMIVADEEAHNFSVSSLAIAADPIQASASQTNTGLHIAPVPQAALGFQSMSSTSSTFISYGSQRKRRCKVCIEAGRVGLDCPGSGGRKKCKFPVCILF